jgi:hypothetical protein
MAAVEQTVVLLILKGRGEVEKVEGGRQALEGIVKIGCRLAVLADDKMVELAGAFVLKDSTDEEGRGTSLEVFTGYPLRAGQQDLVRQLKQAG